MTAEAVHEPVADARRMRRRAAEVTALLRSLANEDRLMLMCELSQGERSVGDLEERLRIRQPTLSQQLGVLREEGLVTVRREGRRMIYRVGHDRALAVLALLHDLYCKGRP